MTGRVKTVLTTFAFIRGDNLVDYFAHRTDLAEDAAFSELQEGDSVTFDVVDPQPLRGPRAACVRRQQAAAAGAP